MPDHIADAIKKVQPATLPRSAHAFECSLRHPLGKICTCGLGDTAKPAPAPLLTDNQLREQMPDKVRCAVEFFHDDRNS